MRWEFRITEEELDRINEEQPLQVEEDKPKPFGLALTEFLVRTIFKRWKFKIKF
jgi:hypothetical protein